MGHGMASIMETIFDLAYLATVWVLVALMARGKSRTRPEEAGMSFRFLLAFLLLALGDSFHVGFRVLAEFLGEGAAFTTIGGVRSSLLGLGGLATAYTMTGFYMVLADARRLRSGGRADAATWIMQSLFALRLVLMALPGNAWEAAVPPAAMGILRNVPLSIAGFLMAALFVAEGRRSGDRAWAGIGWG